MRVLRSEFYFHVPLMIRVLFFLRSIWSSLK